MLTFLPNPVHEYYWDGVLVPGVTSILEDVGIVNYDFLPPNIREMALQRGSDVHTATHYDDENDLEFDADYYLRDLAGYERDWRETGKGLDPSRAGYVIGWRKFRQEKEFICDLIEDRGFNKVHRFAGQVDRSGSFRFQGMMRSDTLADIKCGDCPSWWIVQTAMYASFYESPRRFLRLGVELHKDGTYKLFVREGRYWQEDFNRGLCYLQTYRDKREFNKSSYKERHRGNARVS